MLNISSDVIRGYNDTIILYLLLDRPSYGYQITDAGREYYRMKCEEWKLTLDVVSKFIRF